MHRIQCDKYTAIETIRHEPGGLTVLVMEDCWINERDEFLFNSRTGTKHKIETCYFEEEQMYVHLWHWLAPILYTERKTCLVVENAQICKPGDLVSNFYYVG